VKATTGKENCGEYEQDRLHAPAPSGRRDVAVARELD
jgi:hypothetical protein